MDGALSQLGRGTMEPCGSAGTGCKPGHRERQPGENFFLNRAFKTRCLYSLYVVFISLFHSVCKKDGSTSFEVHMLTVCQDNESQREFLFVTL